MARWQFEAHALTGFQHLAGRNAGSDQTVGLQVGIEFFQGGLVQHLETKEIDAGGIRLTDHIAVVIALIPAFEIHPALVVAPGFHQTQNVAVKMDAFFKVQHAHLGMPWTQYTCHRHLLSPLLAG
ncbi:hypothetical protein D3C78_939670 [compost metagenome]